jgi:transcription factor SPN1
MSAADSPAGSPGEATQHREDESPDNIQEGGAGGDAGSDKDSDLLSEIDEEQFEDYDPTLEEKPVEIDENVVKTLKAAKRKRTDGETTKKPKEGRRPKKRARANDDDVGDVGDLEGRPRKTRATDGERAARKAAEEEEEQVVEENLTPEERRRRAIQRAMDNALKNPTKRRRKKDEIVRADAIPIMGCP